MILVAEIGSNHKGIPALAYEYIRQAKLAGADIVKFQFGHSDRDKIRGMPNKYAFRLKIWADYWDIEFMASIFSYTGLDITDKIGQARLKIPYQIATNNPHLVRDIAKREKETFISHSGYDYPTFKKIFVISKYPTYPEDFVMPKLLGGEWYGYSSHTHGIADALLAVARGAQYIEKHVTLDKTEDSIRDNHFAISFDEFEQMAKLCRSMERLNEQKIVEQEGSPKPSGKRTIITFQRPLSGP